MNVFEDLIDELKEENLLEISAVDADREETASNGRSGDRQIQDEGNLSEMDGPIGDLDGADEQSSDESFSDEPEIEVLGTVEGNDEIVEESGKKQKRKQKQAPKAPNLKRGKEYFKKRAIDDVSSHQMVEHILTGVEREYMKVVPKTFDDFNAKKSLNAFLNVAESSHSEEHKAAEFALMQETEAWGLALLERDKNIGVSDIRHYCENSRPALSSQAMLALARFYRNAPYSETIRAKFDFVITRLFSRPMEFDRRICLFSRDEILGHIQTLYSDWSSIPIYSAEVDDSKIMLTGLSFDDLAAEAENAATFDQLIESDFFGRLRLFKESISELFYEPSITAAAIESNIRIGNAYVALIVRERQKMDAASIQSKYSEFNEQSQSVADAAGRSLNLEELLNELTDEAISAQRSEEAEAEHLPEPDRTEAVSLPEIKHEVVSATSLGSLLDSILNVNRWIMIGGLLAIFIAGGLYVWSGNIEEEPASTAGVTNVDLESTGLSEFLKSGKVHGDTFYGLLLPTWDVLPKDKREEFIQKILKLGSEQGYHQVSLTSKDGKSAGFATETKMEVKMP